MRHKSIYTWGWHCWLHGFVFGYWCLGWALLGKKKCLSDTHLPWDIGSHSGISIHNGLISTEIVLITLKKEPAVTNWIASSPSCSFSSVETLAMILEDCKHQIFNEIPQEYPLKNLTYNSRPQTVREIHQKSSMHERLLLLWEDLCPGFVPRLLCALLRICRDVHSLSLGTDRSGHQDNFAPLKVQEEYFITQNSFLSDLCVHRIYPPSLSVVSHMERPKQNRRSSSPHISSSTSVMTSNIWAGCGETSCLAVQSFSLQITAGSLRDLQLLNLNSPRLGGLIKTSRRWECNFACCTSACRLVWSFLLPFPHF